ncbi:PP2C family protein-serine/threonine phosphatase [Marichromatium sp. AB32]|uniref:PP2C family protein-serine/threonine phosphatase n=1 Tax=Marichromatium sp. AB32 TaxID=2483363 RepID=UPI000F4169CF|nr:SpoIIE family protein phosphatase [Marichromatium sp. AB32]RNE94506.1 response regulator [Marichromatium sp. AB32]
MKILVVDDEAWMRRTLSVMLQKWGHEVLEAADGEDAWTRLQHEPIGMAICDWVMPRLSGLELCHRLRAAGFSHYVYLILLTGKDQTEDIYTAFDAGADDFINKPVNAKELQVRIKAGERVLQLEQALKTKNTELSRVNEALQASQAHVQRDLDAAAAVQRSLLPASSETGLPLRLAWAMAPAEQLAGDIFNFFRLDERHLALYLIDVSGHGVPAAMFSVHLTQLLSPHPGTSGKAQLQPPTDSHPAVTVSSGFATAKAIAPQESLTDPVAVVTRLNQGFQVHDRNMIYFTMVYAVIDTHTGKGSLCQAGHPYPLLDRREGRVETLGRGGLPVGLIPDADYEAVDFQLLPGDRLLLYSDGVTECFAPDRSPFGLERLAETLQLARGASLDDTILQIQEALERWRRPANGESPTLADDISMLAAELDAPQSSR